MNKQEFVNEFEKNVKYLQRTIPPDDIYIFSEQTFMAALYFLQKWSKCADLENEMKENEISKKWIRNICALLACREKDIDITLDLDFKSIENE